MSRQLLILIHCLLINAGISLCQCTPRDSILIKLLVPPNKDKVSNEEDLLQLLRYEGNLKNCFPKTDSIHGLLSARIAEWYRLKGEYVQAIQYMKKSIDESGFAKSQHIIRNFYLLSQDYDSLKLTAKKNEAIDSCIAKEIRADTGYYYTCKVLIDRVESLFFQGDYSLCYDYAVLGERLVPKYYHSSNKDSYITFFITYQADALYSLNKFEQAETLLLNKKDLFVKKKDKSSIATVYGLMGFIQLSKKDFPKAVSFFQQGFKANQLAKQSSISAQMLCQMGNIYFDQMGHSKLALDAYRTSLLYSNHVDSFYAYARMAHVYSGINAFDSADYYFQKGFDKIRKGINEQQMLLHTAEYINENTAQYILDFVLDKGDARLRRFDQQKNRDFLQEAIRVYKIADQLLNIIKKEQAAIQSKLIWRNYARRLYEHAINASLLENNLDHAFYFFEKSRAVLLTDQINEQSKMLNKDLMEKAQLSRKILQLEKERNALAANSPQYIRVQNDLISSHQEMERLVQSIRQHDPLHLNELPDSNIAGISDIRKLLLVDHQGIFELFEGDSAAYSLLITPDSGYMIKINKRDLDSTARRFTAFISDHDLLNRQFTEFSNTSKHLFDLIFLKDKVPKGRLIISPDGPYFPFEALISSFDDKRPVYFLEEHAVSYTYSARFLLSDFAVEKTGLTMNFLGVAPVNFPASYTLNRLPGSDESLKRIAANFRYADQLSFEHASKFNFMRQYSQYGIIQLYTHAEDSSRFGEPVIYFADSLLYLSELIAEQKPITRLIVLSACETGMGLLYKGEGVFSFNRGFAAMGIPASLTSLWSIDSKSTYELTELFYKKLSEGIPSDLALQKAKLEFRQIYSDQQKSLPFYWAACILAGKSEMLIEKKNNTLGVVIGAIAAGLLVLIIVRMLRRKR